MRGGLGAELWSSRLTAGTSPNREKYGVCGLQCVEVLYAGVALVSRTRRGAVGMTYILRLYIRFVVREPFGKVVPPTTQEEKAKRLPRYLRLLERATASSGHRGGARSDGCHPKHRHQRASNHPRCGTLSSAEALWKTLVWARCCFIRRLSKSSVE